MTSRVDMHCHSTASQLSRLGVQRSLGLPECATPPQEVYELAKKRGMDFVTITDHDTIDGAAGARRSSRLLRLRGADRPLCRRAPGGSRPLLRDHSRRPRVAAGPCRRRRGLCRIPSRGRDRVRSGASLLQRRRAADPAPPAATGGALPDLGGPQRVARRRVEHARRRLHRDARGHRHRRFRRPCRRRHRPHLHRGAGREDAGRVSGAPAPAAMPKPAASRAAPRSGRTRRWRWRRGRWGRGTRAATRAGRPPRQIPPRSSRWPNG